MRHFKLIPTAAILFAMVACSTVAPGNDPVVVNAEATETTAAETLNALFTTEAQNHAFIKEHTPQVAAGVNTLRRDAPQALDSLVAVVRAYKNNRSAQNKANVMTAIAVVQELINQAKGYLTQIGS